ncbi:hypothetical protein ACOMHN_004738 [Nucella lapillus]
MKTVDADIFLKDKVSILKAKWKLKGSDLFIGEDFSLRVRTLRKKLVPHLKAAKDQKKRATMIYDHLLIDGKQYVLGDDDNGIIEGYCRPWTTVLWRWENGKAVGEDTLGAVVVNLHTGGSGHVVALHWTKAAAESGSLLSDQAALFRIAMLASTA